MIAACVAAPGGLKVGFSGAHRSWGRTDFGSRTLTPRRCTSARRRGASGPMIEAARTCDDGWPARGRVRARRKRQASAMKIEECGPHQTGSADAPSRERVVVSGNHPLPRHDARVRLGSTFVVCARFQVVARVALAMLRYGAGMVAISSSWLQPGSLEPSGSRRAPVRWQLGEARG